MPSQPNWPHRSLLLLAWQRLVLRWELFPYHLYQEYLSHHLWPIEEESRLCLLDQLPGRCCHRRHESASRLQGFVPLANPLPPLQLLTVASTRSPLELRLLQVLSFAAVRTPSRSFSLDLRARWSGPRCASLQRLSSSNPTLSRESADLLEVSCLSSTLRLPTRLPLYLPASQPSRQPFSD